MPDALPYAVFLSHSAKDKAVVRPLTERLPVAVRQHLKVWFGECVLLVAASRQSAANSSADKTCGDEGPFGDHTDPQRDSIFTKGPFDVLDHATSEIASGSKLGIDATKKIPGEGFKRPWPPLIKMDAAVKAKVGKLFGNK
jgi:hypothetical protein